MKRVFICSPYRPETDDRAEWEAELDRNIDLAHRVSRMVTAMGYLPFAPHVYFTNFLCDEVLNERERGLQLGKEWLKMSDEVWVIGEKLSRGMSAEIAMAQGLGIPILYLSEPEQLIEDVLENTLKCPCEDVVGEKQ